MRVGCECGRSRAAKSAHTEDFPPQHSIVSLIACDGAILVLQSRQVGLELAVVCIRSRKDFPIITGYLTFECSVTKLFVKEAEVGAVGISRRIGITYVVVGVGVFAIGVGWIHCVWLA